MFVLRVKWDLCQLFKGAMCGVFKVVLIIRLTLIDLLEIAEPSLLKSNFSKLGPKPFLETSLNRYSVFHIFGVNYSSFKSSLSNPKIFPTNFICQRTLNQITPISLCQKDTKPSSLQTNIILSKGY